MAKPTGPADGLARHDVAAWIRAQRLPPITKLVLLLVFERAGEQEDGRWAAWPKLATIAEEAGLGSVATVRKHLAALEAAGMIEREARYGSGGRQTTNRIVLLAQGAPTGAGTPPPPAPPGAGEGAPTGAGHSVEAPREAPNGGTNGARAKPSPEDVVPDDFPAELRPHARRVMAVLRDVAERRGARRVTARAVALTVTARPRKPLVTAAHDCAAWIEDHPEVACRDVVARYRRWLDREPDLQGLERVDGNGIPTSAPLGRPANVRPIRPGGRGSPEDLADAERLRAMRLRAEAQA